jgi:hypothetical protein
LETELRLREMNENLAETMSKIHKTTAETGETTASTSGAAAMMKETTADTNEATARMNWMMLMTRRAPELRIVAGDRDGTLEVRWKRLR